MPQKYEANQNRLDLLKLEKQRKQKIFLYVNQATL